MTPQGESSIALVQEREAALDVRDVLDRLLAVHGQRVPDLLALRVLLELLKKTPRAVVPSTAPTRACS
jgi:hypothetical protein